MRLWIIAFSVALCLPASAQDATARAQLVTDVASAAETGGADSAHPLSTESDDLARGRSRDVAVSLAASRCYVAIARGAGIENIDVSFVRGRTVLARDTDTGPSARVAYCAPGTAERVSVRITAFRGQGAFALGVYEQAPDSGVAAPGADAGVTGTPLERLAAWTFAQPGFAPIGAATRETLTEGQHVEREVHFVPGRCYRVLVAADTAVTDVDLVIRAPDGGEVQRDGTSRPDASLGVLRPLCPATAGAYRLAITLAHGSGALAWQAIGSTANAATAVTSGPHFTIGGTGNDFLGTRIRTRATQLVPGGTAQSDVLRATLQTSETFEGSVDVASTSCYVAVGAGAPSMRELALVVHDVLGSELGHSSEHDAFPSARFCPHVSGRARVGMRAVIGYGQAAVQVVAVPR